MGNIFALTHTFSGKRHTHTRTVQFINLSLLWLALFILSLAFSLDPLQTTLNSLLGKQQQNVEIPEKNPSDVDTNEVPRLFLQSAWFNSCCTTWRSEREFSSWYLSQLLVPVTADCFFCFFEQVWHAMVRYSACLQLWKQFDSIW